MNPQSIATPEQYGDPPIVAITEYDPKASQTKSHVFNFIARPRANSSSKRTRYARRLIQALDRKMGVSGNVERVVSPPLGHLDNLRQPLTKGERLVFNLFNDNLPLEWEIYIQPHPRKRGQVHFLAVGN